MLLPLQTEQTTKTPDEQNADVPCCSYARGQQVFLCYGAHTNLELLEHYGFLLQDNPHDTVLLPPELLCSEERQSGVLNGGLHSPTHFLCKQANFGRLNSPELP